MLQVINKLFIKKHLALHESCSYQSAKNVGILYSLNQAGKFESINEMMLILERDGKNVSSLMMLNSEQSPNPNSDSFVKRDISMFGTWKNEKVIQFCESKFDFLIFLDENMTPIMENILLRSKSRCKIGLYQAGRDSLFDLMIKVEGGLRFNTQLEEVYRYLAIIR